MRLLGLRIFFLLAYFFLYGTFGNCKPHLLWEKGSDNVISSSRFPSLCPHRSQRNPTNLGGVVLLSESCQAWALYYKMRNCVVSSKAEICVRVVYAMQCLCVLSD